MSYDPTEENKPELNRGHIWRTEREQDISYRVHGWQSINSGDDVAYYDLDEFCGGPSCSRCSYTYCIHCHPEGPQEDCEGEL
jgi:hypothetical protein